MTGDNEPLEALDYAPAPGFEWGASVRYLVLAMVWQVCLIGMATGYFALIVPQFARLAADFKLSLPPLTMASVAVSHAITTWGIVIVPAVVVLDLGLCLLLYRRGGRGALRWGSKILLLLIMALLVTSVVSLVTAYADLISGGVITRVSTGGVPKAGR